MRAKSHNHKEQAGAGDRDGEGKGEKKVLAQTVINSIIVAAGYIYM